MSRHRKVRVFHSSLNGLSTYLMPWRQNEAYDRLKFNTRFLDLDARLAAQDDLQYAKDLEEDVGLLANVLSIGALCVLPIANRDTIIYPLGALMGLQAAHMFVRHYGADVRDRIVRKIEEKVYKQVPLFSGSEHI